MYAVGDIIKLGNLKGEITEVTLDRQIGFQHEYKREPQYTFIVRNVPESMLISKPKEDVTGKSSNRVSSTKKRKPTERQD